MSVEQHKLDSSSEETDTISKILENMNQDLDHIEEVVIGSEQGTTFPAKIGTSVCNALIDTSATRSCISEKYYQDLSLMKIQFLQNISVRSATGSNPTPIGLVNCSFELGKLNLMVILLSVKILLDLLYWEEISLYRIMFLYDMLKMENAFLIINNKS